MKQPKKIVLDFSIMWYHGRYIVLFITLQLALALEHATQFASASLQTVVLVFVTAMCLHEAQALPCHNCPKMAVICQSQSAIIIYWPRYKLGH